MNLNIGVLKIMAEKYGSMAYSDVVWGIELVNEPADQGQDTNTTQAWVQGAFKVVQDSAEPYPAWSDGLSAYAKGRSGSAAADEA